MDKYYIFKRDKKRCYYCGKKMKFKQITLDHYLPLSQGGVDEIFNVVISCFKCNNEKEAQIQYDYEDLIIKLFKRAVKDGKIIGKNLDISNKELKKEIREVNRLERLGKTCVFQSDNRRFFYKDGYIVKRIYIN